jgi:hypothetical protein
MERVGGIRFLFNLRCLNALSVFAGKKALKPFG